MCAENRVRLNTAREMNQDRYFGGFLLGRRVLRGISRVKLEKLTGISVVRLYELEQGSPRKGVTSSEVKRLAEALGSSHAEFENAARGGL